MSSRLLSRRLIALAFASTLFAAPSFAQDDAKDYPNRSIKIIVPFPAGGPTDVNMRILGQKLSEMWGQGESQRLWCFRVEVRETMSNMAYREGHREWNEDLFA